MASKKQKVSSRNRWLLILGAFIVLFLVFYHILPRTTMAPTTTQTTTDQTANWKTEDVPEYGFYFKYPPTLYAEKIAMSIPDPIMQIALYASGAGYGSIIVHVHSHPFDINKLKAEDEAEGYCYNPTTEDSVINGRQAILVTQINTQCQNGLTGLGVEGGKGYQIGTNIGNNSLTVEGNMDQKELINQIFSTFKFTQ